MPRKFLFLIILAVVIVVVLVLTMRGGLGSYEWLEYESPEALAKAGNFSFLYPSLFELGSDEWRIDQFGERHSVIFTEKGAPEGYRSSAAEAGTSGEWAILEVNVQKGQDACAAYDACEVVSGVAIGINGSGRFQSLLPEIAASFVVL